MSTEILLTCARAARDALAAREDEIEGLDRAIGDGDHYHNVKRGADVAVEVAEAQAGQPADAAMKAIAMKLMSTIGGASGPLISSFFLAASKSAGADWTPDVVAAMARDGTEAIKARGKADRGDKTMLDVLIPVAETLAEGGDDLRGRVKAKAEAGMLSTKDILATKGRAAFLGERAIGHVDPGAMSCFVMICAICDATEGGGA